MKKILCVLITLYISNIQSQVVFTEHDVSNDVADSWNFITADVDNDGDLDIITSSSSCCGIYWYENSDGQGNFNPKRLIANSSYARRIFAADIDGDNDIDLVATNFPNIFWVENIDGLGTFGERQVLMSFGWYPGRIYVDDLDGDEDMDILVTFQTTIYWLENIDGQGNFSEGTIIDTNSGGIGYISSLDLDNDGDNDVLAIADDDIVWFENIDGLGNFGEQQVINEDLYGQWNDILPFDFDNDGDLDLFATARVFNNIPPLYATFKFVCYVNNLSEGFGDEQIIEAPNRLSKPSIAGDIDSDSNIEIVLLDAQGDFKYFKISGGPDINFEAYTIPTSLNSTSKVISADINNDNLIDLISNDYNLPDENGRVVWFENTGVLSTDEFSSNNTSIHPNPSSSKVYINSNTLIEQTILYDSLGRIIKSYSGNEIDISFLNNGFYILKIKDSVGNITSKLVIKN